MTKQEIIKILKQKQTRGRYNVPFIPCAECDGISDTLLARFEQEKQKAIEDFIGWKKGDTVYIVNRDPNTQAFSVSCETAYEIQTYITIDVGKKYYCFSVPIKYCFKTEEEAKEKIRQIEEEEREK